MLCPTSNISAKFLCLTKTWVWYPVFSVRYVLINYCLLQSPPILLAWQHTKVSRTMRILPHASLRVGVFNAHEGLQLDSSIPRMSVEDKTKGIPLTVISVGPGVNLCHNWEKLWQSGKVEKRDQRFGNSKIQDSWASTANQRGFQLWWELWGVWGFCRQYWRFYLRAVASPQYIRSLRGQPANGSLKVSRSKPFNVVDRGVQMDLLRGLMVLDRYLVQRPEFSFPMQTVVWFNVIID